MPHWRASLVGHPFDLEELAARYRGDDAQVEAEDDHFYLRSTQFESLEDSRDVRAAATELVRLLNGATRVQVSGFRPVSVGGISRVNADGSRQQFLIATGTLRSRGTATLRVVHVDGTVIDHRSGDGASPAPAVPNDPVLVRALRLFGDQPLGWSDLYRIFEIIEASNGGSRRLQELGWATRSEIERFTRTANHPQAAGDSARHAVSRHDPPKNPMTLAEAEAWIGTLLRCWLDAADEG